jgi:hypothetical protein
VRRWLSALFYRELTHTEARQIMKIAQGPCVQPRPTRDGYDVSDGRERLNYAYRVLPSITRRKSA